jgi:uncharacterized Zn-binding protein involved in type VI secretion
MPGPIITAAGTSICVTLHFPQGMPVPTGIPTSPNVLFNGIPAVLAGDWTPPHPALRSAMHVGVAIPVPENVLINGRPPMTITDFYLCEGFGFVKPIATSAPNIQIV